MSMDGVTIETIMKKKELLKTRRTLVAAAIGTVNALPYPVIEIPFNFAILRNELQTYIETFSLHMITPGIRPNASGAATVSPDGKQLGKNFITYLIIIIKVCYLLYIL